MTDSPPIITTHIKVALDGTTIDLDELMDIATDARQHFDLNHPSGGSPKAVMRVHFSAAYPGELNSRDTVTLEFEEG